MRLVIVSGLSGSGKTIALHMLEDLGYYCIDNIPAGLLRTLVARTVETGDATYERTAVGIDARNRPEDIATVPEVMAQLRALGLHCELIFLHADDQVLLKRYSETRRKHPLSQRGLSLTDAIRSEREILEPIIVEADLVLDTTRSNVHDLRKIVRDRVDLRAGTGLSLLFKSFAYKRGLPGDADFAFDVRNLPNPYWDIALRPFTGRDPEVAAFLDAQEAVVSMLQDIAGFLERWIPAFEQTNRSYLTIAIGCTGGQHRSVYIAEKLAQRFRAQFANVLVQHGELAATPEGQANTRRMDAQQAPD